MNDSYYYYGELIPHREDRPGPPTLISLIRGWIKEDPLLKKHFYLLSYREGVYIETLCNSRMEDKIRSGYGLALFPSEETVDKRVMICYHGVQPGGPNRTAKVRGYLKPEDPQFFQKLREFLIKGHDMLADITECRMQWAYLDLLPEAEEYARQNWWEPKGDL